MRVLVFGDSITQGFWDREGGWVARLRKHYDEIQTHDLNNKDEPTVFNLGISGDVTQGVIKRLANETEARKWRWPGENFAYIIAIGVNDTASDDDVERSTAAEYREGIKKVIDIARNYTQKIVFVGLTPVIEELANSRNGKNKLYRNSRIKEFDNELESLCLEEGVAYLHVFDYLTQQLEAGKKLLDDGLHPNNQGHELIFQLVRPELDKLLNT